VKQTDEIDEREGMSDCFHAVEDWEMLHPLSQFADEDIGLKKVIFAHNAAYNANGVTLRHVMRNRWCEMNK
jgi:hypothetical protein